MSQSAYIALGGGIDLMTPPRQMEPGKCLVAINYECPVEGGYRRIEGYNAVGGLVPGNGPLLGVTHFMGDTYAVRANAVSATLHKLDGTAWVSVGDVPAGRYEFVEANFSATVAGRALYMVGGGKPYELKGGVLTEIVDAQAGATFIAAHKQHLMLGFEQGSVQFSGIGDPFNWDAATGGAGEIGTTQALTGLLNGRGDVLHLLCRDSIKTLYGSSSADFQVQTTLPNTGAQPYSAQNLMEPYFISERGISSLSTSDKFGDFSPALPGAPVEPLFRRDVWRGSLACSTVSKQSAQYRIWFSDGSGVYLSPTGITTVRFPDAPVVACSCESDTGEELIHFGDANGQVYRLDDGAEGFNGEPITAYLTLAYTDLGASSLRKRFRRVFWDVRTGTESSLRFRPNFDFGGIAGSVSQEITFNPSGGLWNVDNWDEFAWSSPIVSELPYDIAGSGTAIGFSVYSSSVSKPHELLGYDVIFTRRRLRRG